jgi:alkanesulfonate monooxygenase SsuD/methylene tetrahydromethanopterin reductase-like flavin-dependent oxidoreductase (luciferase family)
MYQCCILSQGRTICGLGLGWSKDEYQASNIPFMNRGERADEYLEILKKAWTDDVVQFKGKYYDIPASKIGPNHFKSHIFQFISAALVLIRFRE